MTILENLREKKALSNKYMDRDSKDLLNQYDLTLENALLKLKNRGVQVSDLKNRIKELKENYEKVCDHLNSIHYCNCKY